MQQPVREAARQGGAARQDDVGEEVLAQVHVGARDGVHDDLVDAGVLEPDDLRVEQDLRGPETFLTDLIAFVCLDGVKRGWEELKGSGRVGG